jgi:hypothetical protein
MFSFYIIFIDVLQDAKVRALEGELKEAREELSRLKTTSFLQEQAELELMKCQEKNLKDKVNVYVIFMLIVSVKNS